MKSKLHIVDAGGRKKEGKKMKEWNSHREGKKEKHYLDGDANIWKNFFLSFRGIKLKEFNREEGKMTWSEAIFSLTINSHVLCMSSDVEECEKFEEWNL